MLFIWKFKDFSVLLAGGGRCDSAKFCTNSMTEKDENLLLHFEVVNKWEVSLKSRKGGDGMSIYFWMHHVTVEVLITDASTLSS